MDNIFSFNRFGKLLKKEFYEYFQRFGVTILVFLSFIVIAWGISLLFGGDNGFGTNTRSAGIYALTTLVALFAPFVVYGYTNHQKKGIYYAMLPASSFEKFLSMVIYTLILTPVMFFITAVLLDSLIVTIKSPEETSYLFSTLFSKDALSQYFSLFQTISIFVLANMIFKKQKVAKSLLSIIGIAIIISVLAGKIVETAGIEAFINTDMMNSDIFTSNSIPSIFNSRHLAKELLTPWFWYFTTIISIAIPLAALTGTYFKIKTQKY